MVQSVVSKGKDIEEAISLGLTILGVAREAVSIEVIQQETKGLFRAKPAIVKLSVHNEAGDRHPSPNQADIDRILNEEALQPALKFEKENEIRTAALMSETDSEGKVWVKNGVILGKPTEFNYPTISVGEGIILYKNNEVVKGTTVVTMNDIFATQVQDETIGTKWDVKLDDAKLHAILHIEPGKKLIRKVKDSEPKEHLEIKAEECIEIQNELEYKDIIQKLESLHVIHGFNHNEMMAAINATEAGEFVIASGVKAQEGKAGNLEVIVDIRKKDNHPKKRADGTVDYREINHVPTVNQGQVIAVVKPPVPGIPGITVTNEPLPAKQVNPIIINPGKGIAIIEDGTKIVATEKGRPKIETKGQLVKVSIIQKLVHNGDVNITTGNIHFKGDIDVLGNIEENMTVEADGNIWVTKNINRATVTSKSSITIENNVIGSVLSAGKNNFVISELMDQLQMIHHEIHKIILSMEQLLEAPAFKLTDYERKGLLPLIKLLLGQKFNNFPKSVKRYVELCNSEKQLIESDFLDLGEQLRLCFLSSVPNQWHNLEQMRYLNDLLKKQMAKNQIPDDEDCSIELKYAINSSIHSSGNVTITGQGCYNTKIHSGGVLKIDGILRGGEVYGKMGAYIKEAGSEAGISSHIIVPHDQKIKIDLSREGTIIQIGNAKHTFNQDSKNIEALLDNNGRIIF
ncbi:flagellar assembly protein A [Bacillus sp. CECT 9360]|uniref:flagellar assembly protein A n=1 Tax=Bacillus sp. CECT 9360 TaxID=2845821 RepID=UPI001E638BF6|nr:flagellar assembly protein A [Bacillus sp. CECT 9360]CAH0346427.1 hypothetical protein BCI9360_02761 [Bacillus sp. CECT 9360]